MELSNILSISGKPGLYKVLHQSRGGVVVESLTDGKKMSIGQTQRVSNLKDISMYKTDGDEPLANILKSMLAKSQRQQIEIDLKDDDGLRTYFLEILPDYDQERVYTSDIRKVIKWYNTLLAKDLLNETPEEFAEAVEGEVVKVAEEDSTPKAAVKKVKKEKAEGKKNAEKKAED